MSQTHNPAIVFRRSLRDGMDALSLTKASSKSVGSVTLFKASRLGMLNCGTVIFALDGRSLLMPLTAEDIAELALDTSF